MPGEDQYKILIVDDNRGQREEMEELFRALECIVDGVSSCEEVLQIPKEKIGSYDVAFIDFDLGNPDQNGWETGRRIRHYNEDVALVMITGELKDAEDASRSITDNGFFWHWTKPLTREKVEKILSEPSIQSIARRRHVRSHGKLISSSPAMEMVKTQIRQVSRYNTTVLLVGETGTGKELIARAIHEESPRRTGPFIPANCAGLTETLLESEFFGHVRGAFNDAVDRDGLFVEANGGTMFLDEIAETSMPFQVKLLRAIQERKVKPVGANLEIKTDYRLIAATNQNVESLVQERKFRLDLYERLNVFRINVPPLRERREEIPPLVQYYAESFAKTMKKPVPGISDEALDIMLRYNWPGNVRELVNCIEQAMVRVSGKIIGADVLPDNVRGNYNEMSTSRQASTASTAVHPGQVQPGMHGRSGSKLMSPVASLVKFVEAGNHLCTLTEDSAAALEDLLEDGGGGVRRDRSLRSEIGSFKVNVRFASYDVLKNSWGYVDEIPIVIEVSKPKAIVRKGKEKLCRTYGKYTISKMWEIISDRIENKSELELRELILAVGYQLSEGKRSKGEMEAVTGMLFDPICWDHLNSLRVQLFGKAKDSIEQALCHRVADVKEAKRLLFEMHGLTNR